jgi:hypothetical protein
LLALAAASPRSSEEFRDWLSPKFVARNGADVLAAIARRDDPELQAVVRAHLSQPIPDRLVLKSLQEDVRRRAAALAIEPEVIATRRDLAALAAGNPPAHLRAGWRAAVLAELDAPRSASL